MEDIKGNLHVGNGNQALALKPQAHSQDMASTWTVFVLTKVMVRAVVVFTWVVQ